MKVKTMVAVLGFVVSALSVNGQDAGGAPADNQRPPPQDGHGGSRPGPDMKGHSRPPPSLLMLALDVNHDGVIDADEIANASASLKTLDKNGDGKLTQDELLLSRSEKRDGSATSLDQRLPRQEGLAGALGGPGMDLQFPLSTDPLMLALDENGDGVIDADEIANAPAALRTLDENGDGKLTPDELRPVPPEELDGSPILDNPRPPRTDLLMLALDVNHDGVIDADEIANAPAALKTLDKNGDGKLTPDELRPSRQNRQSRSPRGPGMEGRRLRAPSPLMLALDVNHDGVIDEDEIANAPAALKTLDKNGDGKLTPDELWPARPPQNGGLDPGNDKRPPASSVGLNTL